MHNSGSTFQLWRALKAGLAYFAGVFALAFLFGMIRLMFLTPLLGAFLAVLVEVPFILAFSWLLAGRVILRMSIASRSGERLVMGGIAFVVLLLAELGLAVVVFGNSPQAFVRSFLTLPGATGLAGQLGFALIPWLQGLRNAP